MNPPLGPEQPLIDDPQLTLSASQLQSMITQAVSANNNNQFQNAPRGNYDYYRPHSTWHSIKFAAKTLVVAGVVLGAAASIYEIKEHGIAAFEHDVEHLWHDLPGIGAEKNSDDTNLSVSVDMKNLKLTDDPVIAKADVTGTGDFNVESSTKSLSTLEITVHGDTDAAVSLEEYQNGYGDSIPSYQVELNHQSIMNVTALHDVTQAPKEGWHAVVDIDLSQFQIPVVSGDMITTNIGSGPNGKTSIIYALGSLTVNPEYAAQEQIAQMYLERTATKQAMQEIVQGLPGMIGNTIQTDFRDDAAHDQAIALSGGLTQKEADDVSAMDTELGTNPVEVNFIVPASEDGIVPHVPQQTVSYAELPTYFNTELDALPSLHLLTPDELKASLFPKKSDRNASTVTMNIQPLIVSPETTTMIAALQSPNNPYVYMGDPAQLQPLSIAVKSHVVEVPVTSAPASPLSSSYPVYSPPVESPVTASPVESDPAAPASSAGGDN